MATSFPPTTPSPPRDLPSPPPAPRFGAYSDNWEPYRRKSARLLSQRVADKTPSPRSPTHFSSSHPASKRSNRDRAAELTSQSSSPKKRRQAAPERSHKVSSSSALHAGTITASARGTKTTPVQRQDEPFVSSGNLPTPSKTPQKQPIAKPTTDTEPFARNLFPSGEQTTPRRAKTYSGITMDSFMAQEAEEPIEIFVDSQNRIPEKDESRSNPFYGDAAPLQAPIKQRSRSMKQVHIPGEGMVSIEEASRREDGIVKNFRGRPFFHKYSKDSTPAEEARIEQGDVETHLAQHLTRSSVKPRLLFPRHATEHSAEDEEALTDVEEGSMHEDDAALQTPKKAQEEGPGTPDAPKYAPASPPDTRRTTRSTNKLGSEPGKNKNGRSLFQFWQRTKDDHRASTAKRPPENVGVSQAKRTRT